MEKDPWFTGRVPDKCTRVGFDSLGLFQMGSRHPKDGPKFSVLSSLSRIRRQITQSEPHSVTPRKCHHAPNRTLGVHSACCTTALVLRLPPVVLSSAVRYVDLEPNHSLSYVVCSIGHCDTLDWLNCLKIDMPPWVHFEPASDRVVFDLTALRSAWVQETPTKQ